MKAVKIQANMTVRDLQHALSKLDQEAVVCVANIDDEEDDVAYYTIETMSFGKSSYTNEEGDTEYGTIASLMG